ncbi:Gastrula zinc finger protein XlCGF66.1 [Aquarana catesbeiana]|uniref:Gastrula zinc finger protein XlCGF66.1 n=1 Tax=Aquarana catesbeiana TaxID=8400 RepID=A0A2G9SBV3_AQUCT|nr:Gastrula zinc finger protein XlCGF66.1 [Aquarana catesbeiana]
MVSPSHEEPSPFLVSSLRMEKDWSHMTERIINFTLEIIYLLTGEDYGPMKNSGDHMTPSSHTSVSKEWYKSQSPIVKPPPPSLTPEKNHKKILDVIQKMIELLTGEVPIRCQDVTVYFSMEEWEYLEGHKDLYKDVMLENQPPLTSPDGTSNGNPPERCPHSLYSLDSTQEDQNISEDHQEEELFIIKVEDEENPYLRGDEPWKEKEIPPEISTDGHNGRNNIECHHISTDGEIEDNDIEVSPEENSVTLYHHPGFQRADLSLDPSTHRGCFSNHSHPGAHDETNREGENSPCPQCGGCQRTHVDESSYPCSTCGKSFTQKLHLIGHRKACTGKKCYSCSECGKRFAKKSTLLKHQVMHLEEKPHSCPECGKCFAKKSNLVRHQRMHTGEKPYSCLECGKSFTWKPSLEHHLRKHRGEVPFFCSDCGKCFAQKSYFLQHQRTHKGKEPYSCSECGERFAKRSTLVVHQRSHTNEKPFSCSECGKYFVQKSSLMEHLKMHSGEKSYSCTECGKTFQWRSSLFYHERKHKGLKPVSCSECGKGFAQKSHLAQHQKMHAGQKASNFLNSYLKEDLH